MINSFAIAAKYTSADGKQTHYQMRSASLRLEITVKVP